MTVEYNNNIHGYNDNVLIIYHKEGVDLFVSKEIKLDLCAVDFSWDGRIIQIELLNLVYQIGTSLLNKLIAVNLSLGISYDEDSDAAVIQLRSDKSVTQAPADVYLGLRPDGSICSLRVEADPPASIFHTSP